MNGTSINRDLLLTLLGAGLVLFGVFLLWKFLAGVAAVVLLILLGLLLAVALSAPVEALRRRKVPRPVSSPLVTVGILALLILVVYIFFPELQRQSLNLSLSLPAAFESAINRVTSFLSTLGIDVGGQGGFSISSLTSRFDNLLGGVLGIFSTAIFFVVGVVATIFLAIYLAASPDPVVGWVVRLFPPERRLRAREILAKSRSALLSWLVGRLISMAIIGILSTVALYLIGIPAPVLLGLFSGLVSFVPYIGPIISVIPPALLGLLGNPIHALYVIVAYIIIQQIESNLLTPLIMDKVASIHPAVVIAAVTLLGTVFGFLGALLALPIFVVAKVLIEELWFKRVERGSENGEEAA